MKRKFWLTAAIIILVLIFLVVISAFFYKSFAHKKYGEKLNKIDEILKVFPQCPENLSGILTSPLLEPKYISSITPLGNINPPGHTSPVDHNYFTTDFAGKIPIYAPADSWITSVTEILYKDSTGNYIRQGYTIKFVVCDGLELDFANYKDISPDLRAQLTNKDGCKFGITKDGHNYVEGQCYYRLNYKVKAGQEIGWAQREKRSDGNGYDLPFEIWAANYNKEPRTDVDWSYYGDDRYAHIMCTFDLYTGELKEQFYSKFAGRMKDREGFVQRTIPPLCGQVNQDIVGTIQGMWFGKNIVRTDSIGPVSRELAFVHNNIDPTQGEVSVGGEITNNKAGVAFFQPTHEGLIDREPAEIKADGKIYCYKADGRWDATGRILVQLLDNHHVKVEYQNRSCDLSDKSFINPFVYER